MTEQLDSQSNNTTSSTVTPETDSKKRPYILSVIALLIGTIALGLASVPAIALERPLPNPFAGSEEKEEPVSKPPSEREGGLTLKFKKFSVNLGGKPVKEEPAPKPEPKLELTKDPARWFTISAICCALIGLVISAIGQHREKRATLTAGSMSCCAAAITWQYFAIGIAIGAAAAAFLIVIAILGQMLG